MTDRMTLARLEAMFFDVVQAGSELGHPLYGRWIEVCEVKDPTYNPLWRLDLVRAGCALSLRNSAMGWVVETPEAMKKYGLGIGRGDAYWSLYWLKAGLDEGLRVKELDQLKP